MAPKWEPRGGKRRGEGDIEKVFSTALATLRVGGAQEKGKSHFVVRREGGKDEAGGGSDFLRGRCPNGKWFFIFFFFGGG